MKKQYHFVLDTTNPRERAIFDFLEAFKESRGMKSALVAAFEVYMSGDVKGTSTKHELLDTPTPIFETKKSTIVKSELTQKEQFDSSSDIPDDILDLIDDFA